MPRFAFLFLRPLAVMVLPFLAAGCDDGRAYPALLPLDQVLTPKEGAPHPPPQVEGTQVEAAQVEAAQAGATQATATQTEAQLRTRAGQLRARAAALRGPVIAPQDRAKMLAKARALR